MLIEEWMTPSVHSVKPHDSILHAREMMTRRRVNQLPVMRDSELVGIITDRDLRDAFPSVFETVEREFAAERGEARGARRLPATESDPSRITVDLVMTPAPLSLSPKDSVGTAARLMRRKRIGALPIVEGKRVVGILTRSDVLGAFVALAGCEEAVDA
jgi:acetoin utilization protein AcuB